MNPAVFAILAVVMISFFIVFSSLGNETPVNDEQKSGGITILYVFLCAVFVVLLTIVMFKYMFDVNIVVKLSDLFKTEPKIDIVVNQNDTPFDTPNAEPTNTFIRKKQVFNIPGNKFTYNQANSLCKAYDSRLANYDEIEESYNNGAEWCNYGWSENQLALFPTQKSTYANLQTIKGHENDCGRSGVNGGFIDNPNVRFGVNCYGYKPNITPEESELMSSTTPYPQTKKDVEFQTSIDYWKNRLNEILVSPFNYNNWSRF
jgi:hypothetical protein